MVGEKEQEPPPRSGPLMYHLPGYRIGHQRHQQSGHEHVNGDFCFLFPLHELALTIIGALRWPAGEGERQGPEGEFCQLRISAAQSMAS